jgi:alkylation response protein AidB-like acyl-CoA dehydrogenase
MGRQEVFMNRQDENKNKNSKPVDGSLAEDAAREAGKNDDEVKSTGAVDRTDDATDSLFEKHQDTANSPVYRAFWNGIDLSAFSTEQLQQDAATDSVVENCIRITREHRDGATLFGTDGKLSAQAIQDLAAAGYWGVRIPKAYGGAGLNLRQFMRLLVRMAAEADPSTAGLASVHGCIGVVDPLLQFGNEEQKARFLPLLASGQRLSAFALTEPGAGSDMTNLKVTATRVGQQVLINGRKLFITNAIPGRLIALVVMMENTPTVFVAELPAENETFRVDNYGLHALTHVHNNGLVFNDFPVDARNQLHVPVNADGKENGLIIAYKALNKGRIALCANAAGTSALLLRSIAPRGWAEYRVTFGQQIQNRELVKGGIARAASLIVAMNAMVDWCATLLDNGYRGELECIVAKNLGARALKEIAFDIAPTIHGGRSLLKGHVLGDSLHDFLAPSIYEGARDMLSMSFFLSLSKTIGKQYMVPINEARKQIVKNGKYASGTLALTAAGSRFAAWTMSKLLKKLARQTRMTSVSLGDETFQTHVDFLHREFGKMPLQLIFAMVKHQIGLQDRQLWMTRFSGRVQDMVAMLVTAMYGAQSNDAAIRLAADVFCRDMRHHLEGTSSTDSDDVASVQLADLVINDQFHFLRDVTSTSILQPYKP